MGLRGPRAIAPEILTARAAATAAVRLQEAAPLLLAVLMGLVEEVQSGACLADMASNLEDAEWAIEEAAAVLH